MSQAAATAAPAAPAKRRGGAALVAAGILLSRLAGLIRGRVFAHYLGTLDAADAYNAAFKIPNFLQNLLGEGVLSASFIPVYVQLRTAAEKEGRDSGDARRLASAIAGLLGLAVSLLCLIGIFVTPFMIDLIAPGFTGEKRALTIQLVQIFFPGIGLLVMSAFCIGVLNSHHKFFLSYAAPVVWSAAQIAALIWGGHRRGADASSLAIWAAWGSVAGSLLQLLVQLPAVLRLLGGLGPRGFSPSLGRGNPHAAEVMRNLLPVTAGRGVVQISAWIDGAIASWLPTGAVAALGFTQNLYLLPISLFGMSISAATLPAMSASQGEGGDAARAALRTQLERGLRQIAYPVIPSVVAMFAFGDVIVAALYRTGRFGADQVLYVSEILAGSTLGLLAATQGRLYSSVFYALKDTRTPFKYATLRVCATAGLGLLCGLYVPRWLHLDPELGAAGLTATAGLAGWGEFLLLQRGVSQRIGAVHLPRKLQLQLWSCAAIAGLAAAGARAAIEHAPAILRHPWPRAAIVLGTLGIIYLAATVALGVPEAGGMLRRLRLARPRAS